MRLVVCFAFLLIADTVTADELVFVQAIWRHGDRNPKYVCPKDATNQYWYQGLGQITPIGEKQHFDLGRQIYEEYVTNQKFLNPAYKMEDIYFRSTDVNNTLLSAYSNLLGMYYNRTSNPVNVTFPVMNGWPPGFVPVAVHTVLQKIDHILNVEPECPRRQFLLGELKKTKEYTDYVSAETAKLKAATDVCGAPIDIFNMWRLTESYITEKVHGRIPIIDEAAFNSYRAVEMMSQSFANGQGVKVVDTQYGKIDFAKELLTVRSGGLIRDLIDHMDEKITCLDPKMANEASCKWMGKLKYYAYSSHWATINALLTALGARDKIIPNDLPDFAATFFIELWKTTAGGYAIKARFRDGPTKPLKDVTTFIAGCTSVLCPYMTFKDQQKQFYPTNIEELCNTVPAGWKPVAEVKQPAQSTKEALSDNKTLSKATRLAPNQLLFVQTFFRHGDRTPTKVCPKDANKESTWKEGYGQLTALGMVQQRRLGDMIFDKYVTDGKLLDATYNASQIYIRSTDFNRTIASAISNFVGFYYNRPASLVDRDFPGLPWPDKFTPVPIHTVNRFTDHMGDPNTYCPRQLELMKYAIDSEEVRSLEEKNKEFLAMVSEKCGQSVGLMDLVMPVDSWFIENIHGRQKIFTNAEYVKMRELDRVAENIRHGLLSNSVQNGIDLRVQIPRMRGGSQLYNAIDHMEQKIYCLEHPEAGDDVCGWYKNLKYYAFSAHDSTLNGLLSALGAKESVIPDDLPEYTAAVAFELWMDNNQYKIRVNYHRNYSSTTWEDITGNVGGCPMGAMCLWDKFKERSLPYNPGNIDELCMSGLQSSTVSPTTTSSANTITSFSYLVFLAVIFAKLI